MTCPLIDERGKLFSEKRGLQHRMFSLETTREEKDQKWLRWCVTRIHDSSHDMKTIADRSCCCHRQGKMLDFFFCLESCQSLLWWETETGGEQNMYRVTVEEEAKVVERPFITHFIWTIDVMLQWRKTRKDLLGEKLFFVTLENSSFSGTNATLNQTAIFFHLPL